MNKGDKDIFSLAKIEHGKGTISDDRLLLHGPDRLQFSFQGGPFHQCSEGVGTVVADFSTKHLILNINPKPKAFHISLALSGAPLLSKSLMHH